MHSEKYLEMLNRLFARLRVRYGSAWEAKWAGLEPDAVRADWLSELGIVFERNPASVAYALEHMPDDFPPTAPAFRKICLNAPTKTLALPAPTGGKAPPEVAELMARMKTAANDDDVTSSKARALVENFDRKMADGYLMTGGQKHVYDCCKRMVFGSTDAPDMMHGQAIDDAKVQTASRVAAYMAEMGIDGANNGAGQLSEQDKAQRDANHFWRTTRGIKADRPGADDSRFGAWEAGAR